MDCSGSRWKIRLASGSTIPGGPDLPTALRGAREVEASRWGIVRSIEAGPEEVIEGNALREALSD